MKKTLLCCCEGGGWCLVRKKVVESGRVWVAGTALAKSREDQAFGLLPWPMLRRRCSHGAHMVARGGTFHADIKRLLTFTGRDFIGLRFLCDCARLRSAATPLIAHDLFYMATLSSSRGSGIFEGWFDCFAKVLLSRQAAKQGERSAY